MWLNVGCGPHLASQPWWNIDASHRPGNTEPDELVDGDEPLPYADTSVERIYAGHVMEHIPWFSLPTVLSDWRRVLKSGAPICVVGPDVNRALEMFKQDRLSRQDLWERMEHDTTDSIEAWNRMYHIDHGGDPYARHHWNCTPDRVRDLLTLAGFAKVREVGISSRELDDWPVVGRAEDQFAVLAEKP